MASRNGYRNAPKGNELDGLGGCLFAVGLIILLAAITFGLDCLAAQFVIWTLNGYHVVSGFWHAFWVVITLEFIVGLAAGGGSKLSK
jgi:hypothetical protein